MSELLNGGTLTPAYGRDYKSGKDAKADFLTGKDFVLNSYRGTTYCSIRDFQVGANVVIRFKQMRSVTSVKVPKPPPEEALFQKQQPIISS